MTENSNHVKVMTCDVIHDELSDTKVLYTEKLVAGRLQSEFKFIVNGGPRFTIEPSGKSGSFFLRKTKSHKLVGLLTNGKLDKSTQEIEKLFFLSKLDLVKNDVKPS